MSEQCSTSFDRAARAFRVDLSVLARLVPLPVVRELLARAGVGGRTRRTSSVLGFYLVLALALFPEVSVPGVFEVLTGVGGGAGRSRPGASALNERRARMGSEVFRLLFVRLRSAAVSDHTAGAVWRGRLVCAWDGTTLEAPDTADNRAGLGKKSNQTGAGAFPLVRVVVLVACGSRAVIDAVFDGMRVGEPALVARLLPALRGGMLLLADRGFHGWVLWCRAAESGADLLWRMPSGLVLPVHQVLPDGSGLVWRPVSSNVRKADRAGLPDKVLVRVVCGYVTVVDGHGVRASEPYRLITTLLDPVVFPARELVELYGRRWQVELVIKGLKSTQRGDGRVLRSKTCTGVFQEVWAYLCVHQLLRLEIARALDGRADTAQYSLTTAVLRLRTAIIRSGGRRGAKAELARFRAATAEDITPVDIRVRVYPRVVKHPVAKFPSKRPGHKGGTAVFEYTVTALTPGPTNIAAATQPKPADQPKPTKINR